MKNNKLFLSILIIFIAALIILIALGYKTRIGYLTEFKFDEYHINRTLELNGLNIDEVKKTFTIDNTLNNEALINYIFTNEAITNYSYGFRIQYYSKIFRNSDIYGVYPNINKILEGKSFIKEIKMNDKGSPFGTLISEKKLDYNEKIDNIIYTLLLKGKFIKSFILFIFLIFLIIWVVYIIVNKIELNMLKLFFIEKKKYIFIIYVSFFIIFILFSIINSSIRRKSNLTDLQLIAESKAGYVYKAKVEKSYKNSPFYINNNSVRLNDTNNIKYYGYSLEITNKPEGSWYDNNDTFYTDNNTFIVHNEYRTNGYNYNIQVPTYIGDKYKITIFANQLGSNGNISWYLNEPNNYKEITEKEVSNNTIVLSDIRNVFNEAYGVSDLYLILPQGVNEIKSILIESLNTYINVEYEYTIFTTESRIDNGQILEVNYKLKNKFITNVLIFILMLPMLFYLYFLSYKLKSNGLFSVFVFVIGIILFAFQFWLCFPGYYNYPDGYYVMTEAINNVYYNWHPFIIGLTLHILYMIFGYHTFYIFFINLFLWYVGLSLIILSLYYKFKNRLVILLFTLSFLANIFFANITHIKDITATLFFFFSVSILIFQMLVDVKNKVLNILINAIMYISLIFALLWRHNFIVTIYPIFIIIVYRYLKNIDNKKVLLLKFCSIMLIIAFVLICIVKISPKFISSANSKSSYPPSHLILLQIAGCAVPADDGSLIPNEWYLENKTFEDLKRLYYKNNIIADFLIAYDDRVFKYLPYREKRKLQEVLIKHIIKYPINYIKHMINYSINMIRNPYIFIPMDQNTVQGYDYGKTEIYNKVFADDVGIKFTNIKYNIYSFLYINKIYISVFYFTILSIILFFITVYIWLFKSNLRNSFLLLSFSLAFSSVATIVIVCLFTPLAIYRYISPIIIISILSFISFFINLKIRREK